MRDKKVKILVERGAVIEGEFLNCVILKEGKMWAKVCNYGSVTWFTECPYKTLTFEPQSPK